MRQGTNTCAESYHDAYCKRVHDMFETRHGETIIILLLIRRTRSVESASVVAAPKER